MRRAFLVSALVVGSCREGRMHDPPPPPPAALPPPVVNAPEPQWVPSEFKKGASRWKDTGVYVDGKPVGILEFGELPIALKPVFVEERVSAPKKAGSPSSGFRVARLRHYRFSDYLRAVGVEPARVREIHVYGPKFSDTIVATGPELVAEEDAFLFRFAAEISGKVVPVVPPDFGNGKSPDKVSAVMVYVERTPPTLVRNVGLELDGKVVTDVPYFGEPIRGGVRVYQDDRLVAVIKRRRLEDTRFAGARQGAGWSLLQLLQAEGVTTASVAEAWVISGPERTRKLTRAELAGVSIEVSPQATGTIDLVVAGERIAANAVALHSRPVRRRDLPRILPEERGVVSP